MVANASTPKKCPANARSASNSVLLSPITVAHRSSMPNGDGSKPGSNWMRDQWVANLKKKRMANANGVSGSSPIQSANVRPQGNVRVSSVGVGISGKGGNIAASRRHNATLEKNINAHHRNQHKHSQFATVDSQLIMSSQLADTADAMGMGIQHPAMLFNDMGFFEVESQYVFPSSDAPLQEPQAAEVPTKAPRSRSKAGAAKKSAKPLLKKRTTNLMLEVNQPKPRTPRRKLNTGDAFFDDDYSLLSSSAPTASSMAMATAERPMSAGYSSVGTPSNLSAEIRHMWGPEFDFGGGATGSAFADTFLDLPTPKSAEMPFVTASCQPFTPVRASSQAKNAAKSKRKPKTSDDSSSVVLMDQPRLIRTTSIEQEGLSHFLEQTNLDGSTGSHGEELFQLMATPKAAASSPLRHRSRSFGSALASLSTSYESPGQSVAEAAGAAVNECFGKLSPSSMGFHGLLSPQDIRRTPRGWYAGDFSFDSKTGAAPEFETLMDEYKLSDIDQELDSFYLDAMESLGGDLDLLSN